MRTSTHTESLAVESTHTTPVRSLLVAIGLLGAAALGTQVIIEGFLVVQNIVNVGGNLTLTYIVGGSLATLWYGLLAAGYLRFRSVRIHAPVRLPTRREVGWIAGGVVVSIVAGIALSIVGAVLGATEATNFASAAAVGNPLLVYGLLLIGTIVFIAPLEELIFRGVVQGRLRESFSPALAIGITSVGFALGHVPSYWIGGSDLLSLGVGIALLQIAVGSVILGTIYERTGNLFVAILVHGLTNAVAILLTIALL